MQTAKKLLLVDPQFIEQLKVDREYKQIQKPADAVVRTDLSLNVGKTLSDESLADDLKAKSYRQALHRYFQVGDEVPKQKTSKSNPLSRAAVLVPPATPKKKRAAAACAPQTWLPWTR